MTVSTDARSRRLAVNPVEAAERAGITRTAVFELIRTGRLASLKIGRRRLILVAELERFLTDEQNRQAAGAGS